MGEPAVTLVRVCPQCGTRYVRGELFCPIDAARLGVTSSSEFAVGDRSDHLIDSLLAGRYRIIQRIGEGGMGLVYKARHVGIDRLVAVKVLRSDLSSSKEVLARFHQEARSASRIGHDHIVEVIDFGTAPDGASYFVMEYLEGIDLGTLISDERVLDERRTANIVLQCCKALSAAHEKGIVHRDMKPENIVLLHGEEVPDFVKIVDFGIAKISDMDEAGQEGRKLTKTGMIFGTPEYMSPEQAGGRSFDHRVDIYAVGVIFYECLAGRVPFVGDSFMAILSQHLSADVPTIQSINPRAKVSKPMRAVIYKALEKLPEDRFQTMEELAEAIELALEGQYSRAIRTWKTAKSTPRRVKLILGLGLTAALIAGGMALARVIQFKSSAALPTRDASTTAGTVESVVSPSEAQNAEEAAAAPENSAAASIVLVDVDTNPNGARLYDGDGKKLCQKTPCQVTLDRGRKATLVAKRKKLERTYPFTPERDMGVFIELARPESTRAGASKNRYHSTEVSSKSSTVPGTNSPAASTNSQPRPSKNESTDDLKVPDIFQ